MVEFADKVRELASDYRLEHIQIPDENTVVVAEEGPVF